MAKLPFASTRSRIAIGLIALLGLFTWWVDRSRHHEERGMEGPRAYVDAARNALREIATAQELYSAEHDGRYAAALAELEGTVTELDRRLAPSTGVVASITADSAGSWYEAEVQHRRVPGWRCRMATEGSPAVSTGEVTAGVQACDPVPSGES